MRNSLAFSTLKTGAPLGGPPSPSPLSPHLSPPLPLPFHSLSLSFSLSFSLLLLLSLDDAATFLRESLTDGLLHQDIMTSLTRHQIAASGIRNE